MGTEHLRSDGHGDVARQRRTDAADRIRSHVAQCTRAPAHSPATPVHQATPLGDAPYRRSRTTSAGYILHSRISDRGHHGFHVHRDAVGRRTRGSGGDRRARGQARPLAGAHGPAGPDPQLERRLRVLDGPVLRDHLGARPAPRRAAPVRVGTRAEGRRVASPQVAAQSALPVQFAEQRARADRGRSDRRTERRDPAGANVALYTDCGPGRSRLAGARIGNCRGLSGARIAAARRTAAHRPHDRPRSARGAHSRDAAANRCRECDQARHRRIATGRRAADQRGTPRGRTVHRSREPAPCDAQPIAVAWCRPAQRCRAAAIAVRRRRHARSPSLGSGSRARAHSHSTRSCRMRAMIVDDEPLARRELRRLLAEFPWVEIVAEAGNIVEAAREIEASTPELLFLDIKMPGGTGFDLLAKLEHVPRVIFTTAYDDHAVQAFEVNALDYLLKPIEPERLAGALARARGPLPGESTPRQAQLVERLFIRDGARCWFVPLNEVCLIVAEGNYVRLHWREVRPLLGRPLSSLEERLDPQRFFRANRRQIINVEFIEAVEPGTSGQLHVLLRNGPEVEISRRQ